MVITDPMKAKRTRSLYCARVDQQPAATASREEGAAERMFTRWRLPVVNLNWILLVVYSLNLFGGNMKYEYDLLTLHKNKHRSKYSLRLRS